ncbi:MAG: dTMP kinase [Chloroflexi bacterium]|nr:dTMP kinase [Chloroflexota bacterium]
MPADHDAPAPRGAFITVEGGDGAGKTTLVRSLAACLSQSGHRVRVTFEPGGTELGTRLRSLVLDPELDLGDWDETWLFLAARASHVQEVLNPALSAGELVFSDRFSDSTLAYQGYGRGLDLDRLRRLNAEATKELQPDMTLLLDVPAEVGLARTRARSSDGDRIGDADLAFHRRVNAGFRALAAQDSERITIIDASREAPTVLADAFEIVHGWLDARGNDSYNVAR